jgi:hypothetical protein
MNGLRRLLVRLGIGGWDDESHSGARAQLETTDAWGRGALA